MTGRAINQRRHFRVTIAVDGEEILTIETNMLSGVENIQDYADEVRQCGEHLLAFIGPSRALSGDGQ